jgi:phosphohistidine phosphatase SixA
MKLTIFFLSTIVFCSCNTTSVNYYIVRHAEKAIADSTVKSSDVPLSEEGKKRAENLKTQLQNKNIKFIFSTNTVRTKTTAGPLSKQTGIPIKIYDGSDTGFVQTLKNLKGNVLVIGHSNTVDDVVNGLIGKPALNDLPENQFGDLFIVHKKGNDFSYETSHY